MTQRSELGQFSRDMELLIDAMADGEPGFEGYIPLVEEQLIEPTLTSLAKIGKSWSCLYSTWSNETSSSEMEREYSITEYVGLFRDNKIVCLIFDYVRMFDAATLSFSLLIDKVESGSRVDIISNREGIVDCPDQMAEMMEALCEFQNLFDEFSGNALFFGSENMDYPKDPQNYSTLWTKIEER
jgi:hypothetical protein